MGPARDVVMGMRPGVLPFSARANRAVVESWVQRELGLDASTSVTTLSLEVSPGVAKTFVVVHHTGHETTSLAFDVPLHALTLPMVHDACRRVRGR